MYRSQPRVELIERSLTYELRCESGVTAGFPKFCVATRYITQKLMQDASRRLCCVTLRGKTISRWFFSTVGSVVHSTRTILYASFLPFRSPEIDTITISDSYRRHMQMLCEITCVRKVAAHTARLVSIPVLAHRLQVPTQDTDSYPVLLTAQCTSALLLISLSVSLNYLVWQL